MIVSFFEPSVAVGENVTVIVQVPLAATTAPFEQVPPVTVYCPVPTLLELTVPLTSSPLVAVKVTALEVDPM